MKRYLVCYDIAEPKRLQKVRRICKQYGVAVQYSVFLLEGDNTEVDSLVSELTAVIHDLEDDVRIYPLKNGANGIVIGMPPMPGDTWLIAEDERFDMLLHGEDAPSDPQA